MLSLVLAFVTIAVMALLGTFVYLTNPGAKVNRYFAFFVAALIGWMTSNILENEPALVGANHLEIFLRLDFAFAVCLFYAWYKFCEAFSQITINFLQQRLVEISGIAIAVVLATLALFSDLIITNVSYDGTIIMFNDGILWPIYALYLLLLAGGGLVLLYLGRKRAAQTQQNQVMQQINLVFVGFFIAIGNALFINLVLQTFFPISLEVSRLGVYGMIALVAFTGYAIIRYRFFDVRLAIVRTTSFVALMLLLILIYSYLLTEFVSALFDERPANGIVIVSILLTAIAAVSFQPLHRYIRTKTSSIFYRGYYDPDALHNEMTQIMASDIDIDSMTGKLLDRISDRLHVRGAALAIVNKSGSYDIKQVGQSTITLKAADAAQARLIAKRHFLHHESISHVFTVRELEEGAAKEFLRSRKIELVACMQVIGEDVALLLLGEKLSGEAYSDVDKTFLPIFASEAGIAIRNAQSYQEIKQFSEELEALVKERTQQLVAAQERELQKAKDVAALKDEFVYLATHELRAPITAIKLFLEITATKKHLPQELKESLQSIMRASDHLDQLIDDLLEIARTDSPEVTIALAPVDINQTAREIVEELRPLGEKEKVSIKIVNDTQPAIVQANKDKVREILTNLISNAIKYNRKNGEIFITFVSMVDHYVTEIRDTGIGISNKQKDKIFQKFFRADSPKADKVVGTGLGMFITRMLVEKMGGTINFTSLHNSGTTVAFSLPKPTKPSIIE